MRRGLPLLCVLLCGLLCLLPACSPVSGPAVGGLPSGVHGGPAATQDEKLVETRIRARCPGVEFLRWGPNDPGGVTTYRKDVRIVRVRYRWQEPGRPPAVSDLLWELDAAKEAASKPDAAQSGYVPGINGLGDEWLERRAKEKRDAEASARQ